MTDHASQAAGFHSDQFGTWVLSALQEVRQSDHPRPSLATSAESPWALREESVGFFRISLQLAPAGWLREFYWPTVLNSEHWR